MRYKSFTFLILGTILATLSGCFLFGTKGIFDKSNFKIVKLEIDNVVYLSPQELAMSAKARLNSGANSDDGINPSGELPFSRSRIDSINLAFNELRARNTEPGGSESTPLKDLAGISSEATFNLDRTQDMVYGKTGCNDYTAKFFWQDTTKIVISGAASTRKACTPKEVSSFHNNFMRNLDGIYVVAKLTNRKGYVLNNGKLRIYIK